MTHEMREAGATLIELVLVVALLGVGGALGMTALSNYGASADLRDTTQKTVSVLRNTASRAVSESASYCVRFATNGKSATVFRGACGSGIVASELPAPGTTRFRSPDFAGGGDLTFLPRGSSTGGRVDLVRDGSSASPTFRVTIEPLTSRVTYA